MTTSPNNHHDALVGNVPMPARLPTAVGEQCCWSGLPGAAAALALAQAARAHDGPLLVVTADTVTAERIETELGFFLAAAGPDVPSMPVMHFPDWETLPYDTFSPHQDIISERLSILNELTGLRTGVIVAPVRTLLQRLAPRSFVCGSSLRLKVGQHLNLDNLRRQLQGSAYRRVDTVYEHGEFAVRGAIVDIFPMGCALPFRVDLFDDEIDTLRTFDPESQRSVERIDLIDMLPAREFPMTDEAVSGFLDRWHESFDADPRRCPIYQDIKSGLAPAGVEYYLPLFFPHMETLFDYLPDGTLLLVMEDALAAAKGFIDDVAARHDNLGHDPQRPILPPQRLFLDIDELDNHCATLPRLNIGGSAHGDTDGSADDDAHPPIDWQAAAPPDVGIRERAARPLARLVDTANRSPRPHLLICAESAGRREVIHELLREAGCPGDDVADWAGFLESLDDTDDTAARRKRPQITVAPLTQGLALDTRRGPLLLISEPDLFGDHVLQQRRRDRDKANAAELVIKSLTELRIGAPVVHIDHGVGRYLGLQTLELEGATSEFLTLEYQEQAKLYVPVTSLHLISRYTGGEEDAAPLNRLGNDAWEKAKRKAVEQIRDVAAELLDIYARRAARPGRAFRMDDDAWQRFCRAFPFEETADQQSAIDAVVCDMTAATAMDRLICGDVGFGKTEVAMRAAFLAVHGDTQVAVLVPTTLLAQQHYETFRDRFADWPVNIEMMSRFRTRKEIADIRQQLGDGKADIVIGTHALLGDDIRFKNLGLVIIDEEHRFGVRHKEQLKELRAEVDILTLTATPIPRTLNLALSNMRDLSIIATPPARRLSIKTFVREHSNGLVKEAVQRELLRGGQVYYLHNEVKSIDRTAEKLAELIPEARIAVGHGQMRERQLEKVMSDFYHKRTNVLVCSTIIETGIDIPSANTIIIDRADRFGLAQIHQLRGRVGRSHHQAYAWLLTPHKSALTSDAEKRLEAITNAEALGSGFILASQDLEIRGAGELLGDEQSGQIQSIGFTLYMEMLEQAVDAIKQGKTPNLDRPLKQGTEVNLHVPALIPDDYLPDVHSRLLLYKRIAHAADHDALRELQVEMIDRFGKFPDAIRNLFHVTEVKMLAEALGIVRVDLGEQGGRIDFGQDPDIDPLVIVKLVQNEPKRYAMRGGTQLRITEPMPKGEQRAQRALQLLDHLREAGKESASA